MFYIIEAPTANDRAVYLVYTQNLVYLHLHTLDRIKK